MTLYDEDQDSKTILTCDFATREDMVKNIMVGSRVLVFDEHRRIYTKPHDGKLYSGAKCIRRAAYQGVEIASETSRSWVLAGYRGKISKKTLMGICSDQCADRASWLHENQYKIGEAFMRAVRDDYELAFEMAERLDLGMGTPDNE